MGTNNAFHLRFLLFIQWKSICKILSSGLRKHDFGGVGVGEWLLTNCHIVVFLKIVIVCLLSDCCCRLDLHHRAARPWRKELVDLRKELISWVGSAWQGVPEPGHDGSGRLSTSPERVCLRELLDACPRAQAAKLWWTVDILWGIWGYVQKRSEPEAWSVVFRRDLNTEVFVDSWC